MKKEIDNTFTELPKILKTMIGSVVVDGNEYKNISEWYEQIKPQVGNYSIIFNAEKNISKKVTVKEQALSDTPFFKFNELYNKNNPIPKTEMYGFVLEEDLKMCKMDLWDKEHKIHWVGWLLKSWIL